MSKQDGYTSESTDSQLYSDSEDSNFIIDAEDEESIDSEPRVSDDPEDQNYGPWEAYTSDKYLQDSTPVFKKRYIARRLFSNASEPIDLFTLFIDDEFLK